VISSVPVDVIFCESEQLRITCFFGGKSPYTGLAGEVSEHWKIQHYLRRQLSRVDLEHLVLSWYTGGFEMPINVFRGKVVESKNLEFT